MTHEYYGNESQVGLLKSKDERYEKNGHGHE